jgi:hypothetical protein
LQLQGCGAAGALQPDGLHADDFGQLILHRDPDRFAAFAGDVEVRRLARAPRGAPREDVVRRERAVDRDRDRDAEDDRERHVGEVVDPR